MGQEVGKRVFYAMKASMPASVDVSGVMCVCQRVLNVIASSCKLTIRVFGGGCVCGLFTHAPVEVRACTSPQA